MRDLDRARQRGPPGPLVGEPGPAPQDRQRLLARHVSLQDSLPQPSHGLPGQRLGDRSQRIELGGGSDEVTRDIKACAADLGADRNQKIAELQELEAPSQQPPSRNFST